MLKEELTPEEIIEINEESIKLFNTATSAFSALKQLEYLGLNIQITLAHLEDSPEARALRESISILTTSVKSLENGTEGVKEVAKKIGKILND